MNKPKASDESSPRNRSSKRRRSLSPRFAKETVFPVPVFVKPWRMWIATPASVLETCTPGASPPTPFTRMLPLIHQAGS